MTYPTLSRTVILRAFWTVIVLHLLMAIRASAAVTESFLDRVAMIESNGDQFAVGDNGRSVGRYQIKKIAWLEVNQVRAKHGLKQYPYSYATNNQISRTYAAQFLHIQRARYIRTFRRSPTQADLLAIYQLGFSKFKTSGGNLPPLVKRNIAKLERQK